MSKSIYRVILSVVVAFAFITGALCWAEDPIIAPQLKDKLGPKALEALREEQRRHTNEAVLVVPLGDTMGVITTFDDFTVLTQMEEPNATSLSLFKGNELIQRGNTTFDLNETTGVVNVTGIFENVRTGDGLVSEVSVAPDPSQPDRCSFIIDSRMVVTRKDTQHRSEMITAQTVFDVCREIVVKSARDGSLPADVIEQFGPGLGRTMARIALEDLAFQAPGLAGFGLDDRVPLDDGTPDQMPPDGGIGDSVKLRCAGVCFACFRGLLQFCVRCAQCVADP
jgi:hypothetical protein